MDILPADTCFCIFDQLYVFDLYYVRQTSKSMFAMVDRYRRRLGGIANLFTVLGRNVYRTFTTYGDMTWTFPRNVLEYASLCGSVQLLHWCEKYIVTLDEPGSFEVPNAFVYPLGDRLVHYAINNGNTDFFREILSRISKLHMPLVVEGLLVLSRRTDLLSLYTGRFGSLQNDNAFGYALQTGDMNYVKGFYSTSVVMSSKFYVHAALGNSVTLLQFLYDHDCPYPAHSNTVWRNAILWADIDVLEWMYKVFPSSLEDLCEYIVERQSLQIAEWFRDKGMLFSGAWRSICQHGSILMAKFVLSLKQPPPWEPFMITNAFPRGRLQFLRWANNSGLELEPVSWFWVMHPLSGKRPSDRFVTIDMVRWFVEERHAEVTPYALRVAAKHRDNKVYDYLCRRGPFAFHGHFLEPPPETSPVKWAQLSPRPETLSSVDHLWACWNFFIATLPVYIRYGSVWRKSALSSCYEISLLISDEERRVGDIKVVLDNGCPFDPLALHYAVHYLDDPCQTLFAQYADTQDSN